MPVCRERSPPRSTEPFAAETGPCNESSRVVLGHPGALSSTPAGKGLKAAECRCTLHTVEALQGKLCETVREYVRHSCSPGAVDAVNGPCYRDRAFQEGWRGDFGSLPALGIAPAFCRNV
jgi:hypothetical protein